MFPFASHLAQSLAVSVPVELAALAVFPEKVRPLTPVTGTEVAAIVPAPVAAKDAPVPISMAAVVFVLLVRAEKADEPPPPELQGAPASITLPLASHFAQLPLVCVPVVVVTPVPFPLAESPPSICCPGVVELPQRTKWFAVGGVLELFQ